MSKLFKASLLLTVFFGINKVVALLRQAIIARQYGITPEIDAFNVSNNVPDLLFSLISGGALSLAFIPILTEYLDKKGKNEAYVLFSRIANLVFLSTAFLSVIVAVFAHSIISSNFGVAPGFTLSQQDLTASLMRLNLIATLIFSISGLFMAALQSNKHFLLPAIAPILYNVGQIIGATILTPIFGLGIYGLAYGVILGSILHITIQIPGMIHYKFNWIPSLGLKDKGVQKVLHLMGPRILTVLAIQIMFLVRDNLASQLQTGSVTALTYGYFIMQVPETLIGTAIATALLPTLSQFAEQKNYKAFTETLNKTMKVIISSTLIVTAISIFSLDYLIETIFNFNNANVALLSLITKVYLLGLITQSLLEITSRAFYAKQDTKTPFVITFIRMALYLVSAIVFVKYFDAAGLALADTITTSIAVIIMMIILIRTSPGLLKITDTLKRTLIACVVCLAVPYLFINFSPFPKLLNILTALFISSLISLLVVKKEVRVLMKL